MIIHCYDRSAWESALALPLEAELHTLLSARFRHLEAEGLVDMTDLVVITAETTEADLIEALGWTPLVDPDGRRVGDTGFVQPFDFSYRASGNFHVAVQIVGNAGAAFEFVVRDDADPALISLVRAVAE